MGQPHESSGAANLPREGDQSGGDDKLVIVHLSDLHIADDPFNTRFSERYNGYYAHDYQLARGLRSALEQIVASHDLEPGQLKVLVTGDLTQCGSNRQMAVANAFLHGSIADGVGTMRSLGLGLKSEASPDGDARHSGREAVCIPGNHDQWRGNLPKCWWHVAPWDQRAFAKQFGAVPWSQPKRLTSTRGGIVLELLSLDSNSGVDRFVIHAQAGGQVSRHDLEHFERQASLRPERGTLVPTADGRLPEVVRWLLIHHDFGHRPVGWFHLDSLPPAPLDGPCSELLLGLMIKARIACVLTGHQHSVSAAQYVDGQVRELRGSSAMAGPAFAHAQQQSRDQRLHKALIHRRLPESSQQKRGLGFLSIEESQDEIPPSRHGFWLHCIQQASGRGVPTAAPARIECVSRPYCWDGRRFVGAMMNEKPQSSNARSGVVTMLPTIAATLDITVPPPATFRPPTTR